MPIQMPANADIAENHSDPIVIFHIFQGNAFIDDRCVSRRLLQGLAQRFRRRRDVVEQASLSVVGRLCEVEAKKIVSQGAGGQINKADLIPDVEAHARIINLLLCDTRLFQEWVDINASRSCLRARKPRDAPHGAWKGAKTLYFHIVLSAYHLLTVLLASADSGSSAFPHPKPRSVVAWLHPLLARTHKPLAEDNKTIPKSRTYLTIDSTRLQRRAENVEPR